MRKVTARRLLGKRVIFGCLTVTTRPNANTLLMAIMLATTPFVASASQPSPFDRVYEAKTIVPQFQRSVPSEGALIDLSIDDPVASVEETETEKAYRLVLEELEQSRLAISKAQVDAEVKLDLASKTAVEAALAKQETLLQQRAELERALEMNRKAQEEVEVQRQEYLATLDNIRAEGNQLLMMAEANAEVVETKARTKVQLERIDPTVVLNEAIEAEFAGATLREIVTSIMPEGWRVEVEFSKKPELEIRRYQFISTDPRDVAIRRLLSSVRDARVSHQYFWDLTKDGEPAPMILLSVR